MARAPSTFKQQDLTRALVAAKKAGVDIARIKITKDGNIEMDTGKPPECDKTNTNPWDQVLPDEQR